MEWIIITDNNIGNVFACQYVLPTNPIFQKNTCPPSLFFSFLAISIYVEESYNDWSIPAASIITE